MSAEKQPEERGAYCPLLSMAKVGMALCIREHCAWYIAESKHCALREIAISLDALYSQQTGDW